MLEIIERYGSIEYFHSVQKGKLRAALYYNLKYVFTMYFNDRDYLGFIMKVRAPTTSLLVEEGVAEQRLCSQIQAMQNSMGREIHPLN